MNQSDTFFLPESVYNQFLAITQRPHPSANQKDVDGDEDPVREYVISQAQAIPNVKVVLYNKEASDPGKRVIVLRRPGSGIYANKLPVILQAHMDMVYNPVDMVFPLNVIVDPNRPGQGKWIKAMENSNPSRNSTLGADDGLGVATALALLADDKLKAYPLECLFTVQEETDMGGAQNFDLSYLTGRQLLNIDAEDLTVIIYGSAGGSSTQYQGDITRISTPQGYCTVQLSVTGLKGGHSGVDINKGRLNAIKVLAQALVRLDKRITALDVSGEGIGTYDLLLNNIKRFDVDKSNAIPAQALAVVVLPKEQADQFVLDFKAFCNALKTQNLPEENTFEPDATIADVNNQVPDALDEKSTDNLLGLLQQIPHGVISMIPDVPGVVETSTNLYDVTINGNTVTIGSSNRSSRDTSLTDLNNVQANIGPIFQFNVTTGIESYPSWQPNPNSPLLKIAETVYSGMYGDRSDVTVIHAGLECGTISARYEEVGISMDCISIGPTIRDPHSPSESLQVQATDGTETVQEFYDAVTQILGKVFAA
jgi:dipeptidase D